MNKGCGLRLSTDTDQAEKKQREGERGAARASDHMRTVRELEQQYEASIGAKDGIYIKMMLLMVMTLLMFQPSRSKLTKCAGR